MPRPLTIRCPGCGDEIEIDPATGKILLHRKKGQAAGPVDLLEKVKEVERKKQEAGLGFDTALQELEQRKKKAETLFDEARRKAQEELEKHGGVPPKEEDGW